VIIPLNELIALNENRYIFTRAAMKYVDRIGNIEGYPEKDHNWKVVPNILRMIFDGKLKFEVKEGREIDE
jgi:hypothetical protein